MSLEMLGFFIKILKPNKTIPVHINDFSHYETLINDIKLNNIDVFPKGKWINI